MHFTSEFFFIKMKVLLCIRISVFVAVLGLSCSIWDLCCGTRRLSSCMLGLQRAWTL